MLGKPIQTLRMPAKKLFGAKSSDLTKSGPNGQTLPVRLGRKESSTVSRIQTYALETNKNFYTDKEPTRQLFPIPLRPSIKFSNHSYKFFVLEMDFPHVIEVSDNPWLRKRSLIGHSDSTWTATPEFEEDLGFLPLLCVSCRWFIPLLSLLNEALATWFYYIVNIVKTLDNNAQSTYFSKKSTYRF